MTVKVTIGNRVVQQIHSWLVSADLPDWPIQPLIIQISGQSQSELPRGPDSCLESPSNAGCLPTGHTDAVPAAWRQNASRHLAHWRMVPRRDGITSRERPAPLRKGAGTTRSEQMTGTWVLASGDLPVGAGEGGDGWSHTGRESRWAGATRVSQWESASADKDLFAIIKWHAELYPLCVMNPLLILH